MREQMRIPVCVVAGMPREQVSTHALTEQCATVVCIDDQIARVARAVRASAADQKVAWEVDAFHFDPCPLGHFHVYQRQRDRNAGSTVQYFVQEAVARVVVLRIVADESLIVEQEGVQREHTREKCGVDVWRNFLSWRRGGGHAATRFATERIESVEVDGCVELGVCDASDHEGGNGEVWVLAVR